jgi:hypothetical protein
LEVVTLRLAQLTNIPGSEKAVELGGMPVLGWTALPPQAGKGASVAAGSACHSELYRTGTVAIGVIRCVAQFPDLA